MRLWRLIAGGKDDPPWRRTASTGGTLEEVNVWFMKDILTWIAETEGARLARNNVIQIIFPMSLVFHISQSRHCLHSHLESDDDDDNKLRGSHIAHHLLCPARHWPGPLALTRDLESGGGQMPDLISCLLQISRSKNLQHPLNVFE